jgi:hypothetical protein
MGRGLIRGTTQVDLSKDKSTLLYNVNYGTAYRVNLPFSLQFRNVFHLSSNRFTPTTGSLCRLKRLLLSVITFDFWIGFEIYYNTARPLCQELVIKFFKKIDSTARTRFFKKICNILYSESNHEK